MARSGVGWDWNGSLLYLPYRSVLSAPRYAAEWARNGMGRGEGNGEGT